MSWLNVESHYTMTCEEDTRRLNQETKYAKTGAVSVRANKINSSSKYYDSQTIISLCIATAVFVLTPYIHFDVIYSLWSKYTLWVDRETCSCDCWDTTFKGNYETEVPGYKHIYFNITSNSLKIWTVSVVAILLVYETIRKICHLIVRRRLRISMLLLTVASIYPQYYSWWVYFNYWNDDFYQQWNHQLVFTATELASTYFVVHLLDTEEATVPWKLMVILSVATAHCVTSLTDQFNHNVIQGKGMLHQVLRDIGLMLPDVLLVVVPLWELRKHAKKQYIPLSWLISNAVFCRSICLVIFVWMSSKFL